MFFFIQCRKSDQHFKPYLTPDLPKRLHYAKNVRIDKVHLMVDRQWLAYRFVPIRILPADTSGCELLKPRPTPAVSGKLLCPVHFLGLFMLTQHLLVANILVRRLLLAS